MSTSKCKGKINCFCENLFLNAPSIETLYSKGFYKLSAMSRNKSSVFIEKEDVETIYNRFAELENELPEILLQKLIDAIKETGFLFSMR